MIVGGSRCAQIAALILVVASGFGCSGGGGGGGSIGFDCNSGQSNVMCLESCNLGCSSTGCQQTNIAQNEVIILTFSDNIDVNSVNSSSIRFRTPTGDEPVGEFLVNDNRVEFVPTVSISGGQTFYGFTSGETYTMTIVGGQGQAEIVRSTSGKPFGSTLTCTLQSTEGIVDLNGVPPAAVLVSPTNLVSAPLNSEILLEFNELIDATPFLSGTQSPIEFSVRRTMPVAAPGTGFACDPQSQPQALAGSQVLSFDAARGVSLVSFTPAQTLPGNVCIEISVTNGVTDLSGRTASPQLFQFLTEVVPLSDFEIIETFDDEALLDADASAGVWDGGSAQFAEIGGDGRHGPFSIDFAFDTEVIIDGKRVFELDTNNTLIPANNGTVATAQTITDGRYFFSTMVVPADIRLRFVGNDPPIVNVAGRLDVLGDIEIDGESITTAQFPTTTLGQVGAMGGIYGGQGGQGGNRCLGVGSSNGQFNGGDGEDVTVLAAHGYFAQRAGTGGKGSSLYPASGLSSDQQFGSNPPVGLMYCLSACAGGAGGGLYTSGQPGQALNVFSGSTPVPNASQFFGPPSVAGLAFPLFPFPPAVGLQTSSDHFLVGGAGGGGSASNSTLSLSLARTWSSGAAGGGGGGAMALRAGRALRLGPSGNLLARGGSAYDYIGQSAGGQVAPAGGGSGGSIILQAGGTTELTGQIDVRGGSGGFFRRQGGAGIFPNQGIVEIEGGDGGVGFVRLEKTTAPDISDLANMQPPATLDNIGTLQEVDTVVSMRSLYYSTNLIFGPEFARYELEATVDGVPMVFSDDPAVSTMAATQGAPVRVQFQAANLDIVTGEVLNPVPRPWRNAVRSAGGQAGIASDGLNGYRFMLFVDRNLATNVTVEKLTVVYRN